MRTRNGKEEKWFVFKNQLSPPRNTLCSHSVAGETQPTLELEGNW